MAPQKKNDDGARRRRAQEEKDGEVIFQYESPSVVKQSGNETVEGSNETLEGGNETLTGSEGGGETQMGDIDAVDVDAPEKEEEEGVDVVEQSKGEDTQDGEETQDGEDANDGEETQDNEGAEGDEVTQDGEDTQQGEDSEGAEAEVTEAEEDTQNIENTQNGEDTQNMKEDEKVKGDEDGEKTESGEEAQSGEETQDDEAVGGAEQYEYNPPKPGDEIEEVEDNDENDLQGAEQVPENTDVTTAGGKDQEKNQGEVKDEGNGTSTEKKNLVELLDFEIVLMFERDRRQRLLRPLGGRLSWGDRILCALGLSDGVAAEEGGRNLREEQTGIFNLDVPSGGLHRREQDNLRGLYVRSTLMDYLNVFFRNELAERESMGIYYTPLDEVYLTPEGEAVESESTHSYSAGFSGVAIFKEQSGEQRVPKEFAVQSIQLQALNDESGQLLRALKKSDPEGIAGLDKVKSVSANILKEKESGNSGTISTIQNQEGGGGTLDTVIIIAIAVAGLSMILLIFALYVAYRRQKNSPVFYDARGRNQSSRKSHSSKNSSRGSKNKMKATSSKASDRSSPTDSNPQVPASITASSSPTHDGDHDDNDYHDDESSAPGARGDLAALSELNENLYPDAVSINDDIMTSFQDYDKFGTSNPAPYDRNVMDDSSVLSVDSSQYGYSLNGYSTDGYSTTYGH